MTKQKRALISGITGQDGSYLAELLLSKGYEVHGIIRRLSTQNLERINHIYNLITVHQADITDDSSIIRLVNFVDPDEIYNLAAQSYVPESWATPLSTSNMTGLAATRFLEAIRMINPSIRYYQASSSEMFGKVREIPQTEQTPFYPRSPYGVSKVYAHYMTVNYRESYGLFAASGILFNHETNTPETPVLIRKDGIVDVVELDEIAPKELNKVVDYPGYEIWDNGDWTPIKAISRYVEPHKDIVRLCSRSGYVECTNGHKIHLKDGSKSIEDLTIGDEIVEVKYPPAPSNEGVDQRLAWVCGFFCGDGSLHGKKNNRIEGHLDFFNKDLVKLNKVKNDIRSLDPKAVFEYTPYRSGYKPENCNIRLRVHSDSLKSKLADCYVEKKPKSIKRVPKWILNSDLATMESFLDGYAEADGTKSLPNTRYKLQYYTTISQTLAAGLRLLCAWTDRHVTYNSERRDNGRTVKYYHKGFIRSRRIDKINGQIGRSGHNLMKNSLEITKLWNDNRSEFITVTTDSGSYSAGTGLIRIFNSPRRGLEFVTRKITDAVARIKLRKQNKLYLGNLDSQRDWGHAKDYVYAMWLMLQAEYPKDYVIGTGKMYSVRQFVEHAFNYVGLNYNDYVEVDSKLYRPAEVDILLSNPEKAKNELGWTATTTFEELVEEMVDADIARLKGDNR